MDEPERRERVRPGKILPSTVDFNSARRVVVGNLHAGLTGSGEAPLANVATVAALEPH